MKHMSRLAWGLALVAIASACERQAPLSPSAAPTAPSFSASASAPAEDPVLVKVRSINAELLARGSDVAIEGIDYFTIGVGRPSIRIHQEGLRPVPGDPRRLADGDNITYLVRASHGVTASGLSAAQTAGAIDAALSTWDGTSPLKKVTILKRSETATDPDIFDGFFKGFGDPNETPGSATPFQADIVEAGWRPRGFFEAAGGAGGGRGILAFTVKAKMRSEEHTSELQSLAYLVCRLLLEKKKKKKCIAQLARAHRSNPAFSLPRPPRTPR